VINASYNTPTEKLNLNPSSHIEPVPEPTAVDHFFGIAKAAVSGIPVLGSPAAELFGMITAPILGRRRDEWFEELRLRLNELSRKVEGLSEALTEDAFVSALAQATHVALRTHQAEKLEALRNAVLNVAVGRSPSDDLQLIFLNLVDSFTPTHLQVLKQFVRRDSEIITRLRERQPELIDLAVRDLRDRSLLRDARLYAARNRDFPPGSLIAQDFQITDFGKQFLDFITTPEAER
jgi:hypothetical protein